MYAIPTATSSARCTAASLVRPGGIDDPADNGRDDAGAQSLLQLTSLMPITMLRNLERPSCLSEYQEFGFNQMMTEIG
jgi:hypothetical protein